MSKRATRKQADARERNFAKYRVTGAELALATLAYDSNKVLRHNERQQLRKASRILSNVLDNWKPKVPEKGEEK